MLNIKETIVQMISQIEVEESANEHTHKVTEKLLEALFWYGQHLKKHQQGVNKAMGIKTVANTEDPTI